MEIQLSEKGLDKVAEEIVEKLDDHFMDMDGHELYKTEASKRILIMIVKETILGLSIVRK